ncbi:putative bacteriocin export ABC transporter, lactococcin 972 group [Peptoniphilus duerdenii ATCC BAA-1640]|uniref:Putative bacteriocin export ABC transporter, lactococcin 972 group n=1 Tax=Peptoniphilus duerdenii ATCC BAA-1640 TaxID=862517 RepID=E0NIS8_9FIRM|nr:ABC transporter ATP-binding protein [Peptoniphilus duerdenii]EFM26296.1 putative bacteriocin export ABC transporter, lactococcin 972 group [Peptoniphilus duerdenii ATCC BAA-1640]
MLEVQNIKKIYRSLFGKNELEALKSINFTVEAGEYIAIMGESGSGKTTLLNILALLDRPTSGKVILMGKDLQEIKDNEMAKFRRENLGFVFQDFNLLDNFTVKENILLPLVLSDEKISVMEEKLSKIAKKLSVSDLLNKYPYEISGGQKQRTAIARALISDPKILLADEPTGALDSNSTRELLKVFKDLNQDGETILMVTHSIMAASEAKRVLFIKDGEIYHQIYRGDRTSLDMQKKIADTMQMLQRS